MKVVYTVQARDDLRELGDWIAKDNPRRAHSFIEELRAKCRALVNFPARFPVVAERRELEVRRCVHGDYVVLFSVSESSDSVVVLRVAHGARDFDKLLSLLGLANE